MWLACWQIRNYLLEAKIKPLLIDHLETATVFKSTSSTIQNDLIKAIHEVMLVSSHGLFSNVVSKFNLKSKLVFQKYDGGVNYEWTLGWSSAQSIGGMHIHTLFTCTALHLYWTLFFLGTLTILKNAAYFFSSLNGTVTFTSHSTKRT
jgi:hypothetical protein